MVEKVKVFLGQDGPENGRGQILPFPGFPSVDKFLYWGLRETYVNIRRVLYG
jgi:hypothetical protein